MDTDPKLLTGPDVIRRVVRELPSSGRILAAVAYVTVDHLPWTRDDVLVVNAGKNAVEAGATDPRRLLQLWRSGVQIYSDPSLHAKAIVRGNVVALGSANLSARTLGLNEAVIVTHDAQLAGQMFNWIKGISGTTAPMTEAELEHLCEFFPPGGGDHEKSGPEKRSDPFDPNKVDEILLWAWDHFEGEDDDFDEEAESDVIEADLDGYEWIPNEAWNETHAGQVWMRYERKLESPRRVVSAFSSQVSRDGARWTEVGFDTSRRGLRPLPSWLKERHGLELRARGTISITEPEEISELLGLWNHPADDM